MLESESRSRDNVEKAVSDAKMQVERIKLQVKCLEWKVQKIKKYNSSLKKEVVHEEDHRW